MLSLYIPKLEDYWYEEKLQSDSKTMSYNAGYDVSYYGYHYDTGCIDFPKQKWKETFDKRINENKFFAYIKDSDYFVLLSDSEAMPYCVMEAIAVNTKVIVTPLEAYEELGIVNGKNGFIIPFNYFEDKNKKKLTALIKKIYKEKDKQVKYKLKESAWDKYNDVFVK